MNRWKAREKKGRGVWCCEVKLKSCGEGRRIKVKRLLMLLKEDMDESVSGS